MFHTPIKKPSLFSWSWKGAFWTSQTLETAWAWCRLFWEFDDYWACTCMMQVHEKEKVSLVSVSILLVFSDPDHYILKYKYIFMCFILTNVVFQNRLVVLANHKRSKVISICNKWYSTYIYIYISYKPDHRYALLQERYWKYWNTRSLWLSVFLTLIFLGIFWSNLYGMKTNILDIAWHMCESDSAVQQTHWLWSLFCSKEQQWTELWWPCHVWCCISKHVGMVWHQTFVWLWPNYHTFMKESCCFAFFRVCITLENSYL